jgi:hypothetical protein
MSARDHTNPPSLEQLLDYHLGQLPIEECASVKRRLAEDPATGETSRRLADTLSVLDGYRVPPVGERLVQRTLQRIAQAGPAGRLRYHAAPAPEPAMSAAGGSQAWFSLRDLVAVAATIVLVLGILSPTISRTREIAQRTMCANQLGSLGQSLASYSQSYEGQLPMASSNLWRTAAQPTSEADQPSPRQRAHLYVLVATQHAQQPKAFLCPANRRGQPMSMDDANRRSNFPSLRNCTYSYQDPAGTRLVIEQYPQFPVLADENPYLLLGPRIVGSWPGDNSRNHPRAAGQNVLRLNGAVRWQNSPWCGRNSGDNIWQRGQWAQLEAFEAPPEGPDAYLFP